MLLGKMDDDKIHRIEGAACFKGKWNGAAFCKHRGLIELSDSEVITCPKCSEIHQQLTLERLSPPQKEKP